MNAVNSKQSNKLAQMYDGSNNLGEYARQYIEHMAHLVKALDIDAVSRAAELIRGCAEQDQTFFVMGNGGSGAVGGHWVNDLSANTVVPGKPGFRAMSLTDNAFSVTAIANDASYEEIFSIQLAANMRPGDVVMGLSVSGNSPNIVKGAEYAKARGGRVIGCTGMSGGELGELSDVHIHTPSSADEYGPVEDIFSVVMHVIQTYIAMERGRYLAH